MPTASYTVLRRFAFRALDMLDRHKGREASLEVIIERIGASAAVFAQALERAQAHEVARSDKLEGRHAAVAGLHRKLRTWTTSLVHDVENLDRKRYGDNPDVPEEVIGDALELLALLAQREHAGVPLPAYTPKLRDDLGAAIELAKAEVAAAGGTNAAGVDLRDAVQASATIFQADLVAFRRALRAFVGSSHPDYQQLRQFRGKPVVPDEDEEDDAASTLVGSEGVQLDEDDDDANDDANDHAKASENTAESADENTDAGLDKAG